MANHPWMPPLDTYHDEDFPYHQGRELMITPHEAPEPFDGPSYYRPSDPSSTFDGDGDAVIKQHKTRSQLVAECLPRGAAWPTDDGTKSSQHIGLTIQKTIKTTKERGSQVVVCKLNLGQMHKGIPARVVAKIYDPLYYPFLACALPYASDVVRQADMDLSREAAVYQHFKTMGTDGQFAPKYYGAFTMPMRSNIAGKYRPVCLILLEHIDGSTMRASCTVPYNRIPALVPGPHAGNDDQRMLVMKELVDIESKMRHTGVVYGTMMPENVMISRPSPTKANAALKPHSCSRVADARGQHETAVLKTAGRDLGVSGSKVVKREHGFRPQGQLNLPWRDMSQVHCRSTVADSSSSSEFFGRCSKFFGRCSNSSEDVRILRKMFNILRKMFKILMLVDPLPLPRD